MKILDLLKKPVVAIVGGVVLGLILGLIIGWGIWPVQWKDADPSYLNADYATDYLRMTLDSYTRNPDGGLALQRYQALGDLGPAALEAVQSAPGIDTNALLNFKSVIQASTAVVPTPTTEPAKKPAPVKAIVVILVTLILVGIVGFLLFRYLLPLFRGFAKGESSTTPRTQAFGSQAATVDKTAKSEDVPIAQFITTFVKGDDLYDDSFSIEAPNGDFLGECGIGISEIIGVGDPKKVTAFEVWLFDKSDIQTVTKVLMSNHAFQDQAIFQRLQAKGEPIELEPNKQIVLETKGLILAAVVTEMEYAPGPLPDKSHFERLTLELAVWPKVVVPS